MKHKIRPDGDCLLNPGKIRLHRGLASFAEEQGWTRSQAAFGPVKYRDANGVLRLTLKRGSDRAAGSNFPHAEVRNAAGTRIDPKTGARVLRKDPVGNHRGITFD